jgi:hypothetical protein
MVFVVGTAVFKYGNDHADPTPKTYCVNNPSASDYGECYNVSIYGGKAIFVQTDTSTYPELPCESKNLCIRYTSRINTRYLNTVFNYPDKQAILQFFKTRSHAPAVGYIGNINYLYLVPVPGYSADDAPYPPPLLPAVKYGIQSWPIYDPVSNFEAYLDPYNIPSGHVHVIRWNGMRFAKTLYIIVFEGGINNIWYASDVWVVWSYESSPIAVIPLDYDREYLPYQELRNAFGYAITGVDQPGWNADDIISILRELFPDRAWAVFDDRTYTLYLYNLTADYIPDWLVERLAPISMKVLKQPADSSAPKAWLDELNRRNYNTPPSAEV